MFDQSIPAREAANPAAKRAMVRMLGETLDPARYFSTEFARLERERLWAKSWLMACREEELASVGAVVVFDIADQSIIVARSAPDTISAFHNACPHRGRRILASDGKVQKIHCPFHGWQWNLQGENIRVLDEHDWDGCGGLAGEDVPLAEVRVGRWGGFVFISMDPHGESFEDFIQPVPERLDCLRLDRMRYAWRKTVQLKANWKVAQEAFMESYHVLAVHPQLLPVVDDRNIGYARGQHGCHHYLYERSMGAPSRRLNRPVPDDLRQGYSDFIGALGAQLDGDGQLNGQISRRSVDAAQAAIGKLPEGLSASEVQSAAMVAMMEAAEADGALWPQITAEQYEQAGADWNLFPNLSLVFGVDACLVMRARPHPSDPERCELDLMSLLLWGEGKAPTVQCEVLNDWPNQIERIPPLLLQDVRNMEEVQRGLHSFGLGLLRPNPIQEKQITHFHTVIDQYLARE